MKRSEAPMVPGARRPLRWVGRLVRAGALVTMAVAAATTAASAQSRTDVLVHATALGYVDSQAKDAGWVAGFYATHGWAWRHLVEVGATRTAIDYLDGVELRQSDAAIAYSWFGASGSARAGVHVVSSTDPLTDGGVVLFGGASRYRVGAWSAGAEGAFSSYADYQGGLRVFQVAPSAGFIASDPLGERVLGATLRGYYIRTSADVGLGSRDFLSGEASVSWTLKSVTVSGYAWAGEQAFAVRGGGFTVYNIAELHTGGFGGGVRWVASRRAAVSVGYAMERFEDAGLANRAWTRVVSASVGFTP